jgi:methyl-accepting chemotaxis protein
MKIKPNQSLKITSTIGFKFIAQISLLLIVVCSVLAFLSYSKASTELKKSTSNSMQSRAVENASLFGKEIKRRIIEVETIAKREGITSMDWDIQKVILEEEAKRLGVERFQISDTNGTTRIPSGKVFDLSKAANFQKSLSGITFVASPLMSEADKKLILIISTPIKDNSGKVIGVLGSVLDAKIFNGIVQDIKVGNSGYAYVLGNTGKKIAHKDLDLIVSGEIDIEKYANQPEYQDLVSLEKRMINGESGFGEYYSEGNKSYMAFSPIPDTEWSMALTALESEMLSGVAPLRNQMAIFTFIFIMLGLIIGYFIANSIKKPLVQIRNFASELAECNLTYRINLNRNDEFGQTSIALNQAVDNLQNVISLVNTESKGSLESSSNINKIFSGLGMEIQQISAATEEISAGMEESSASIQQVTAMLQTTNEELLNVAKTSKESLSIAEDIKKRADNLKFDSGKSRDRIKEVFESSKENLTKSIEKSNVVKNISMMADEILDIAGRTNLLALNAAIEAARAGEHGRGFAIVADEVRKLAEQSSSSVVEIQNNVSKVLEAVQELSTSSQHLISIMEDKVLGDYDKFLHLSEEYDKDGKVVADIFDNFSKTLQGVNEAINEVFISVSQISKSVQETTSSTSEIAGNVNNIDANSQTILTEVHKNTTSAEVLEKHVEKFII